MILFARELTYELLDALNIPAKWSNQLRSLPQETVFTESEFNSLLNKFLNKLGSQNRTRVLEAAAIAFYHQQTDIPIVQTLVCDDAPQFKLLTSNLALCWVHEGRHYKKLTPFIACHQKSLDDFLKEFWDYYRELLAYSDCPSTQKKLWLQSRFWEIFGTESGYKQLDERSSVNRSKSFRVTFNSRVSRTAVTQQPC